MSYFESLQTNIYNDYLMKSPKKSAVLKNAKIEGAAAILPESHNRALIITTDNAVYLQSYDTLILSIDNAGNIKKLWNEYSQTTLKHINSFMALFHLETFNKKSWLSYTGRC